MGFEQKWDAFKNDIKKNTDPVVEEKKKTAEELEADAQKAVSNMFAGLKRPSSPDQRHQIGK